MTTATEITSTETQNSPPLLEVVEMTKRFGTFTALDHVSMTLKPGTFHALLGENGAGKSTLVKCIMGFYTPTSGQVRLNQKDCTIASPRDAQDLGIGMVYQHFTSVPAMSVAENLALRTFDRPPQSKSGFLVFRAIREAAQGLINAFKIKTPSPETPVRDLSGGNVQRTVLARELSEDHIQLLITANPCFGLDFKAVEDIHNQILQARNRGVAVLLVSEDLDELLKLSDRILVMSGGKFVYESLIDNADFGEIGRSMTGH